MLTFATRTAAAGDPASALPPADLHERVLMLPGAADRPVKLRVTVFTPDGPGPFPLAVLNHGATKGVQPAQEPRYRTTFSAYYFLSRGYAVAMPMMRGFADSGGSLRPHGCEAAEAALEDARDIAAVIEAVSAMPGIDGSRIVVGGQSFGGWNTLGVGALNLPAVRGLINFNGGMRESDCSHQDSSLSAGAAFLAGRTSAPSIWFYGDNDSLFPPDTWRAMFQSYKGAGGRAELVAFGTFMDDSHQLLSHIESLPVWTPKVDAFLARIGLPSANMHPAYLPTPLPAATRFAALADAAAVPYVNEAGRDAYRAFLKLPPTRAFVLSPGGIVAYGEGGFDPIARMLALCGARARDCRVYAVDDAVVWTPPSPDELRAATTRTVSRAVPAGVTTTINFAYGVKPDCTSKGLPRLQVTQPPTHGKAAVLQRTAAARFPAESAYGKCDGVQVPGMSVDYTPADGYVGSDALTFEEVNLDNQDLLFRVAITVK